MPDSRFVAFRDALREDETAEAFSAFNGFDVAIDEQETRESAIRDIARGIVARTDPGTEAHVEAQSFLQAVSQAQEARIEAKYDFALYLQDGPSASDVAQKVQSVIEATEEVEASIEGIQTAGASLPIPPALSVTGPGDIVVTSGEMIEATFTVTNVGVSPAGGLDVIVSGYNLSTSLDTIGALDPGAQKSITLTGSPKKAGETPLTLSVGASSARSTVVVLDLAGHLERALTKIADLKGQLNTIENDVSGGPPGKGGGGINGLRNKLETAEKRIEDIMDSIDGGSSRPVSNQINAVSKQIGAFINQTRGWGGQHLSDRTESLLAHDAEGVIEELHLAAEAN